MNTITQFKNVAPPLSACLLGTFGAIFFLLIGWVSSDELGVIEVLIGAFLVAVLLMFLSAMLLREKWLYGIELKTNGFLFQSPLRQPRFVEYTSIQRIVASAILEGDYGESAITLRIKAPVGRVWIQPQLLFTPGLLNALMSLPEFDRAAWKNVDVPEGSLWRSIFPKRTIVFRKS